MPATPTTFARPRAARQPAGTRIPVGISSCLLGEAVRYDGGHRRSALCLDDLSAWLDYVPLCPEMAIGLGAPRESIRLIEEGDGVVRLRGGRSGADHTDAVRDYARARATALGDTLCGYIVSKKSPTCGMERVKVHGPAGQASRHDASGVYTGEFMRLAPLVPVEEDGRLHDMALRENFLTRVFVLHRWRRLQQEGITAAKLLAFHTDHKYLVLAHHPDAYRRLGRLLADCGRRDIAGLADEYIHALMPSLATPVDRGRHANVLQHLLGYFRRSMPERHRAQLADSIEQYRTGELPLGAPLALLRHFLAEHPHDYLERQVYLAPHPARERHFL